MNPIRLPSNEAWGRKSGGTYRDGTLAFKQGQWGAGPSGDGKNAPRRFHWPLPAKLMPTLQRRAK